MIVRSPMAQLRRGERVTAHKRRAIWRHAAVTGQTSANRNEQTKVAIRCYECEGFGHFATKCPTRLSREARSTDSPGKGNPRERTRRSQPPDQPSQKTNRECRKKPGIRETSKRCDWRQLSLHLNTPENAVNNHKVSISMEHGAPTISIEIQGTSRSLISDTGSIIFIVQPGVSRSDVHFTAVEPYAVTGMS